jgi:hypothetical protein
MRKAKATAAGKKTSHGRLFLGRHIRDEIVHGIDILLPLEQSLGVHDLARFVPA